MHEVTFVEDLANTYIKLKTELEQNIYTNEREFKLLQKGKDLLSQNSECGDKVSQRLPIFKYYAEKYGADNVWVLDVSKDWRLIYTLTGEGIKLMALILDLIDHKTYERIGGYS